MATEAGPAFPKGGDLMLHYLSENYVSVAAMILFGIGFCNLLLQRNMIKKIIGLNIMDTAVYLFLASMGYISIFAWFPMV